MMLLNGLFLFPPSRSPRLHSLDALRGLDMLIILGLDALVLLLASRNPESAFLQEAARQMTHARWEGLHLYDLVFPVFVFISGVSMSFSLGKYTSGNASSVPGLLHLWKRALVLAFLGLLVNGTLTWTESMRYASVLGLIGFPAPLREPASCCAAGRERLPLRRGSSWPSLPCSSSPAATSRRTAPSTHGWTGTGSPVVCMGEFLTRKARSASFPLPSCVWEDGWQGNF